MIAAMV